jgi:hypothetical protein
MTDFLITPLAQDPAYHLFADQRALFGVPNFWNVASNFLFLVVGALGLREASRHMQDPLREAWFVFFAGILLTALGSGYYHLAPDNHSLAWDRLAMTIGFMSFLAIVIGEYVSPRWGARLLVPLLIAGAFSVWYWIRTEGLGAGDLRPYAVVALGPLALIVPLVLARRERSDLSPFIGWMLLFYVAAKLAEHYDREIYAAGELLSGHSIKHLAAALASACLLLALTRRRREQRRSRVADFPG